MQLNESEAVPSPSSVAAPQGCAAQGMLVESSLPSQLLETLVAKVADKVSPRFATVLPAQPTTPGSFQLTEVAACSSSSTSQSTFASPSTNGSAPIHSSASPEDIASSVIQQSAANAANSLTEEHWLSSTELNLFTDASGSLGFGAIFGSHWSHGKWPPGWEQKNIAFLEFYPIVLSLHLWGEAMCNQCILFFTDIESLVHVIYKQSCKDKSLMLFVRKLVSICLYYNIVFKATHISGVRNKLADALSHPQVHTFG